jgi:ferredoxin
MARTDANPPMPEFREDYVLQEVDAAWLGKAVKPKQFIHIDQSECIMCEGCVDICPWKCIHMVATDAVDEAVGVDQPGPRPERPRGVPRSTTTCAPGARSASTAAPRASSSWARSATRRPAGDLHQRTTPTATATA